MENSDCCSADRWNDTDIVKSFTAEQVANELKDCETIDDAIRYFEDMK